METAGSKLITLSFWGGPRDGDQAYQSITPPEYYIIPITEKFILADILGFPVMAALPEEGMESHVYELTWDNPRSAVYRYRGVRKL